MSEIYAFYLTTQQQKKQKQKKTDRADLELLLQLAVETGQHAVGLLVFADGRLDLPPLSARQPGRQVSELSSGNAASLRITSPWHSRINHS